MKNNTVNTIENTAVKTSGKVIPDNAMVIAEGQYFDLNCYNTKRNNNVLVVGAAGTGKTRGLVIPNILQATGSYIISDPKGNLHDKYGEYLKEKGYDVKLLNFEDPYSSVKYNPLNYIHCQQDVIKLAHMLVYGKERDNSSKEDPFWDRSAELLMIAIIDFLWEFRPEEEQNFDSILKLVEAGELNEGNPNHKSPLEIIFEDLGNNRKDCMAYRYFKRFNVAAIRTRQSILVSLASHIGRYNTPALSKMMSDDTLELDKVGHRKTAIFVQVSDSDRSMDDLANIFFTQAVNELVFEADNYCEDNKLPVDVRIILDDFATNCKILEFPRMIASIRSRGISTMLMIQAESQLEMIYGPDAKTIIGNCDTYVYLGCNDLETARNIATRTDRSLDNILYMPIQTAWVFRRGEHPVYCKSFLLEEHESEWGEIPHSGSIAEMDFDSDSTYEDLENYEDDNEWIII